MPTHALKKLSKKRNEFPVMLYMNSDELYNVSFSFSFVHQTEEAPPFSCFYYSLLITTRAHMLWLMSGTGKAAIVHHNYLRTGLKSPFASPVKWKIAKRLLQHPAWDRQ